MPSRVTFVPHSISIRDVATYHQDTEASLRLFFTSVNPQLAVWFAGDTPSEVAAKLAARLNETDLRSSFAILSQLEAAFRIDYTQRCKRKKRDAVSKAFRALYKTHGCNVRLEDDIFATWRQEHPETKKLIGELQGAFKFRHWLAHGRHWTPKLGRKYDYRWIYTLADSVLADFPFYTRNS
jgi:hypothetical protein